MQSGGCTCFPIPTPAPTPVAPAGAKQRTESVQFSGQAGDQCTATCGDSNVKDEVGEELCAVKHLCTSGATSTSAPSGAEESVCLSGAPTSGALRVTAVPPACRVPRAASATRVVRATQAPLIMTSETWILFLAGQEQRSTNGQPGICIQARKGFLLDIVLDITTCRLDVGIERNRECVDTCFCRQPAIELGFGFAKYFEHASSNDSSIMALICSYGTSA